MSGSVLTLSSILSRHHFRSFTVYLPNTLAVLGSVLDPEEAGATTGAPLVSPSIAAISGFPAAPLLPPWPSTFFLTQQPEAPFESQIMPPLEVRWLPIL